MLNEEIVSLQSDNRPSRRDVRLTLVGAESCRKKKEEKQRKISSKKKVGELSPIHSSAKACTLLIAKESGIALPNHHFLHHNPLPTNLARLHQKHALRARHV